MEIHHGHSDIRTWRTFALEFLMIAIAVFVGSMGEYYLEHKIMEERRDEGLALMLRNLEADQRNLDEIIRFSDSGLAYLSRSKESAYLYRSGKISRDQYFRRLVDDLPNNYQYRTFFLDSAAFNSMSSAGLISLIESPDLKSAISDYYAIFAKRLQDNNSLVDSDAKTYYYDSFPLQNPVDVRELGNAPKISRREDIEFYLTLPRVIESLTADRFITDTDNLRIRVLDYRNLLVRIRSQNQKLVIMIRSQ